MPLSTKAQAVRDTFLFPRVRKGVISDMTMSGFMKRRGRKPRLMDFDCLSQIGVRKRRILGPRWLRLLLGMSAERQLGGPSFEPKLTVAARCTNGSKAWKTRFSRRTRQTSGICRQKVWIIRLMQICILRDHKTSRIIDLTAREIAAKGVRDWLRFLTSMLKMNVEFDGGDYSPSSSNPG